VRLLPYSKQLVARRAAGERPWLVVVTIGNEADRKLMRMGAFDGDTGIARIWVPDDFNIAEADLSWVIGLDVFVAPFCDAARATEFIATLWRARPATLWQLDAGFTATRLYAWRSARGGCEFSSHFPARAKLDKGFRARVESARDIALIAHDAPLFNSAAFDAARASRMRELGVAA